MINVGGYTLSWFGGSVALSVVLVLLSALVVFWGRKSWARLGAVVLLVAMLCHLTLLKPSPKESPKTIVVLQDETASADTKAQDLWLKTLKNAVGETATLKLFPLNQTDQGTRVLPPLKSALQSVPEDRLAGAVIISDTLWHDAKADLEAFRANVPIHVLSTFQNAPDRSVVLEKPSSYQLVGKPFALSVTVRDTTQPEGAEIPLNLYHGQTQVTHRVRNGEKTSIPLSTDHPGRTPYLLATPPLDKEAKLQNNAAVFTLTVFRDRWRVMMVSGSPHPSTRAFRSLFKQDPNMDLVHFSILRRMDSVDFTPPDEMALIPFPVDELFLDRIHDFDVIVMDRYVNLGLLQPIHLQGLRAFIQKGGAFLVMTGSEGTKNDSLLVSLRDILNLKPAPQGYSEAPITPLLGQDHPITQPFLGKPLPPLRGYLPASLPEEAEPLLEIPEKTPLLSIWPDTQQHGRMAWVATDDLWTWRRPQGQEPPPFNILMRRLMHWLLREPDLEAPPMICQQDNAALTCTPRGKAAPKAPVHLYHPEGVWQPWAPDADGVYRAPLNRAGLWAVRVQKTLIPIPFDMGPPAEWTPVPPSGAVLAKHNGGRHRDDPNAPLSVTFDRGLSERLSPQTLMFDRPSALIMGQGQAWPWTGPALAALMGMMLLWGWRRG
jgi:hypothetical protein